MPKYISEVPKDIFTEGELHYTVQGDGYLLYSVGVNGKDDGGKSPEDAEDGSREWDDITVRMPAKADGK